jgi:hypothetical protein
MSNGGIIGPVNDPIVSVASSPGTATFNSSGTYTSGPQAKLVDYLVVAGGGGGGKEINSGTGGGGGAGGYRTSFPCGAFPIQQQVHIQLQ